MEKSRQKESLFGSDILGGHVLNAGLNSFDIPSTPGAAAWRAHRVPSRP